MFTLSAIKWVNSVSGWYYCVFYLFSLALHWSPSRLQNGDFNAETKPRPYIYHIMGEEESEHQHYKIGRTKHLHLFENWVAAKEQMALKTKLRRTTTTAAKNACTSSLFLSPTRSILCNLLSSTLGLDSFCFKALSFSSSSICIFAKKIYTVAINAE